MSDTFGNAWDWVWERFHGLDSNDPDRTGGAPGILGDVSGGQTQTPARLSLPGLADSGAPDPNPMGYVARAEAGSPPALVDPSPRPILRYANGDPVVDPNTRSPYPRPPGMDVSKNARGGDVLNGLTANADMGMPREITMASLFAAGMPEDYQRPNGLLAAIVNHDVNNDYRSVTEYNLGVVAAHAGYTLEDTLHGAGLYNKYCRNPKPTDSKYGNDQSQVNVITQGWHDGIKW